MSEARYVHKPKTKKNIYFSSLQMLCFSLPLSSSAARIVLLRRNISVTSSLINLSHSNFSSVWNLPTKVTKQTQVSHFKFSSLSRVGFCGVVKSNSTMASQSQQSVHDFTVKDARGNEVDLSTYKGKVLLIVNVASQCGLSNTNYTELATLYGKYKDQGLEILAFPCNQFGEQEPGNNEQILEFACTRFKAEYPIFDKVDVNGANAAPVYKFLKSSKGGLFGDGIKWNFAKFLVDKDGHVVDRYAPTTSPLSFEKKIKKLLGVA